MLPLQCAKSCAIPGPMTANDLQDLIIRALARQNGGTLRKWRAALGPVRVRDTETHPHCNWSVTPCGGPSENEMIEQLLDDVRLRYPLITAG